MKKVLKKIIPDFLLSWYHYFLVFLGAFFYGFPSYSRKIKIIGVTGTSGKSTVVYMINQILKEAGYKTAFISSIEFEIAGEKKPNLLKMTMPGRFIIQKFLREAISKNCQFIILEVTSEGIKQHRHCFINFDTAIFTNLSPEHIEAHKGFENYKKAKGELFKITKNIHIINQDDSNVDYFLQFKAKKKYLYKEGQIKIINEKSETLEILNNLKFNLKLKGNFNIYNALSAISAGLSQGIDLEICQKFVEKIEGIPGRMEEVISEPFKVIVDYAFTPNALEKAYQSIREMYNLSIENKTKMICVLGACGGGRDKWKRPVLGKIAIKNCDEVIVTNEDPYDENPLEIINQVVGENNKVKKILNRREAIKESLLLAKKGDVVIITGKGCELWICLANGRKMAWDDRVVVKEEFQKILLNK